MHARLRQKHEHHSNSATIRSIRSNERIAR